MSVDIPYTKTKVLHKVSGSAFDSTAPLVSEICLFAWLILSPDRRVTVSYFTDFVFVNIYRPTVFYVYLTAQNFPRTPQAQHKAN